MKLSSQEQDELSSLISKLNSLKSPLEKLLQEYNSAVADAHNFVTSVAERLREEYNDKPEEWQESQTGEEAEFFIDSWEEVDFTQDIQCDLHHAETLNNLLTEIE